jgi:hypothetical protein
MYTSTFILINYDETIDSFNVMQRTSFTNLPLSQVDMIQVKSIVNPHFLPDLFLYGLDYSTGLIKMAGLTGIIFSSTASIGLG